MMVLQQLKLILLTVVGLFRRIFCCFKRRRKLSQSDQQFINVVVHQSNPQKQHQPERNWDSWDDTPRTVEEHIEQYRQRIAKPPTPQKEDAEPDFFSELTPDIQPQPKYYLGQDTQVKTDFSRLEAKTDIPIAINADLEDWVDEEVCDWEELDSEKTKQMIREKRREMRSHRQKNTTSTTASGIGIGTQHPKHDTNGIAATRLTEAPRAAKYYA